MKILLFVLLFSSAVFAETPEQTKARFDAGLFTLPEAKVLLNIYYNRIVTLETENAKLRSAPKPHIHCLNTVSSEGAVLATDCH